jgi:hypothetical protein
MQGRVLQTTGDKTVGEWSIIIIQRVSHYDINNELARKS